MIIPKITPPFSKKDEEALLQFADDVLKSRRPIDRNYSGFTHDEAIALLLPFNGFEITYAEFGLSLARGELPFEEVDENGEVLKIIY